MPVSVPARSICPLGTGPGAEERPAIAIIVIGGQSLCLLSTLVVTPVAYSIFDDWAKLFRVRRYAGSESRLQPVRAN